MGKSSRGWARRNEGCEAANPGMSVEARQGVKYVSLEFFDRVSERRSAEEEKIDGNQKACW